MTFKNIIVKRAEPFEFPKEKVEKLLEAWDGSTRGPGKEKLQAAKDFVVACQDDISDWQSIKLSI